MGEFLKEVSEVLRTPKGVW